MKGLHLTIAGLRFFANGTIPEPITFYPLLSDEDGYYHSENVFADQGITLK